MMDWGFCLRVGVCMCVFEYLRAKTCVSVSICFRRCVHACVHVSALVCWSVCLIARVVCVRFRETMLVYLTLSEIEFKIAFQSLSVHIPNCQCISHISLAYTCTHYTSITTISFIHRMCQRLSVYDHVIKKSARVPIARQERRK